AVLKFWSSNEVLLRALCEDMCKKLRVTTTSL
ncbi:hypothetical protein Pgy4_41949, partial [Pseudomonas savastanoi pv. glycinea str. race 4]